MKTCQVCNKEFIRSSHDIKRYGGKFCSRSCSNKARHYSLETIKKMSRARLLYYKNGGAKPTYWLGKKRSPESIAKFIKSIKGKMSGDKNPNWRGGITNPRAKFMKSDEYKDWRWKVFTRDDFRCYDCGAKSGEGKTVVLQADHIYPYSRFPRLRLDINNGRTLCKECHENTPTFGGRAVNYQLT